MTYTKENIHEGIIAKIGSINVSDGVKKLLLNQIPQYPIEIEQNVLEWVNNQPLTDVDCYGESIVRTMQNWSLNEQSIPFLICGFVEFKETKFTIPNRIWQMVVGAGYDC